MVYFGSELIFKDNGAVSVYHDRLGSTKMTVPHIGTTERMSYYPFGEERSTNTTQNQVKFATYYREGTSGLDYANQRWYDSRVGRFLTVDPGPADLRTPQSFNRYAYVANDPVNGYDPTGTYTVCVDGLEGSPGVNDASNPCVTGWPYPVAGVPYQAGTVREWDDVHPRVSPSPWYLPNDTSSPAFTFANNASLVLTAVNWDTVFGYLATAPFPIPAGGPLTWEDILAALRAHPLTAILAIALIQDGGSGPNQFPRNQCPKGPSFWDPTKSPGKNWEWRGKGPVGSSQGSWYNPITNESLHPDLNHQPPIGSHWDFKDPTGQEWRCFPDGTYKKK